MTDMVVVTRHEALVQYLLETETIPEGTKVIKHASVEEIKGKHVVGVLPLFLAAEAEKVTVINLILPPELRGQELTLEQVREYASKPETYEVRRA